jgi:hypothetical protein
MKHIIVLKGLRNTGKSMILKHWLPGLLERPGGKRVLYYRNEKILLLMRPLHECGDWKQVMEKARDYPVRIVILPAWTNDIVEISKHCKQLAEEVILFYCPEARLYTFQTEQLTDRKDIEDSQSAIAAHMKSCIDTIIDGLL